MTEVIVVAVLGGLGWACKLYWEHVSSRREGIDRLIGDWLVANQRYLRIAAHLSEDLELEALSAGESTDWPMQIQSLHVACDEFEGATNTLAAIVTAEHISEVLRVSVEYCDLLRRTLETLVRHHQQHIDQLRAVAMDEKEPTLQVAIAAKRYRLADRPASISGSDVESTRGQDSLAKRAAELERKLLDDVDRCAAKLKEDAAHAASTVERIREVSDRALGILKQHARWYCLKL